MDASLSEIARSLFQLAWADGHVNAREVEVISAMLERLGVPMVERLVAMDHALAEPPKQAEDLLTALPDAKSRQDAMEMLVGLCFADGQTHPEELRILGDLAVRWGIGADDLEAIRRKVTGAA